MKDEKKRGGTKAQIRAMKEREGRIAKTIFLAIVLLVIIFSAYLTHAFLNHQQDQTANTAFHQLRAAIVDQASCSPAGGYNEVFIRNTTDILRRIGYSVDYYSGDKVTVELYRNLPIHGYRFIILRVHAALTIDHRPPLSLFTSQSYDEHSYVAEQLSGQILGACYGTGSSAQIYFGITDEFIAHCLNGKFQNTTIIMTGCNGLTYVGMANAFISAGAKAYMAWDKSILFSHTDTATVCFLQHLIVEKQTIRKAVENTMIEVGTDPAENSMLAYYPPQAGEKSVEDINNGL